MTRWLIRAARYLLRIVRSTTPADDAEARKEKVAREVEERR